MSFIAQVHIENGELIMGIICKKTVGAAGGGLMHICQVKTHFMHHDNNQCSFASLRVAIS